MREPMRSRRGHLETWAKIGVTFTTLFLLTSVGGAAIMTSPALVPALWWAAHSSGRWARAGLSFLAALLMAEVGWFVAYSAAGEDQPYIALGPSLAFVGTIAAFWLTLGPRTGRENASNGAGSTPVR